MTSQVHRNVPKPVARTSPPASFTAGKAKQMAILVNSSDGFQDCWAPFFTLFTRFGGELRTLPITLNTERKDFSWPGLHLNASRVWPVGETVRPTWSECLRRAVESIPEPYILYFQEDYFLRSEVDSAAVTQSLASLQADQDACVAYLFRVGPLYKRSRPYDNLLVRVIPPSRYLASTQCAIWRKESLLALLRNWENGWMFEIFGSHRARRLQKTFLAVRPEIAYHSPVVDYVYTGVVKGQWKSDCVSLFEEQGINVDFSQRGMYLETQGLKSKLEVARKLTANPRYFLQSVVSVIRPITRELP